MPLPVPVLDDKGFDDLAAEARALIPRTFPAWTDHNPSDPGITVLELFAFLAEAVFYQLDRVPERTVRRFAELTGAKPRPGEPVDELLRRAVQALGAISRAITPSDVEFVVTKGLFTVHPPLDAALDAGAVAQWLDLLAGAAFLHDPVDAGATVLVLAGAPPLRQGDLLLVDDEEPGADRTEVVEVASVQPGMDTTSLGLRAQLRYHHDAGIALASVVEPDPPVVTALARAAPAGTSIVTLDPLAELRGSGVLRLGPDGQAALVRARAVARAMAVTQLTRSAGVIPDEQVVKVLLVPDEPGAAAPEPSDALAEAAFALLRVRSPITTRVRVAKPTYRRVRIAATVVRDFASLLRKDTVQRTAEAAVREFLSPLRGGDTGTGWPFGRAVYRSELYQLLEDTPGVDHVRRLLLDGDPARSELPLADDEVLASESLVALDEVAVTVVDA
ncbi:MAG TPA: hypothetical protein VF486_01765 [Actinomycetes bacterium]